MLAWSGGIANWVFQRISGPFLHWLQDPRCIPGYRFRLAKIYHGRVVLEVEIRA